MPGNNHNFRIINPHYYRGFQNSNATNDAADEIINAPDRHLMSQAQLFEAEGGMVTLMFQLGMTVAGAGAACAMNPRMLNYFKNGQLRFAEWAVLGGMSTFGYIAGQRVGTMAFGNNQAVHNHWMAYSFVKSQNRFEGRQILSKAPSYY